MVNIKAFKALRPKKELYSQIASLPYDVPSLEECKAEIKKNPLSLLRIIRPEAEFDGVDPYSNEVYAKEKSNFDDHFKKGYFVQDEKECLYVYKLTKGEHSQTGFVAAVSVSDYENGIIKRHEKTRIDKENDRVRNIETIDAQTGFVFLTYRAKESLDKYLSIITKNLPEIEFSADDAILHSFWVIRDDKIIKEIIDEFKKINAAYIADGHHRCAACATVAKHKREKYNNKDGEYNYSMSILYPDNVLKILPYNRAVKDLNGNTKEELLEKIKRNFSVQKVSPNEGKGYVPEKEKEIGMYLSGEWYLLKPKKEIIKNDPQGILDVSILHENIVQPILNIIDLRTDKRIDFIGGNRNAAYLTEIVDKKEFAIAFSMYPTSVKELMDIADANELMPPKSTWFEPKPRSGMAIHLID